MIQPFFLYLLTTVAFVLPILLLYFFHAFTIMRSLMLLFALDSALTIEVALYGDVVSIAILHIVTIPVFFTMIYFDLRQHHKIQFICFLCGKEISVEEEISSVKRVVIGRPTDVNVHSSCINPGERNAVSERIFRKGIPK